MDARQQPTETDKAAPQTAHVKTYGCQMNVYDSQRMGEALAAAGYTLVDTAEAADLVLLNTCHIREKAAEKVYSEIGKLRRLKAEHARAGRAGLIAVAGCVAQAEGEAIIERAPAVDLVVGPQSYHRLGELIDRARAGERVVETEFAVAEKFARLSQTAAPAPHRAVTSFLTVQEGCDKFCTFCVVPYTRGAETSRPAAAIIAEAERLAGAGVREITLLGQNVNAWQAPGPDGGQWGLGQLLARLAQVPGLSRLRYTTSHPRDMDDALIAAHRDLPALMPYLHLPVQSGSDRILKAMNRRHTARTYLSVIERVRAARPDMAISGDFIVGFPGETDADFEATMALIRTVGYASAYSFKYSPRPGTPAADMTGQVPDAVKDERLQRLQALVTSQQAAFQAGLVGRRAEVLIEKPGRKPGQMAGRSPWLVPVIVDEKAGKIGDIVDVRITASGPNSLKGEAA